MSTPRVKFPVTAIQDSVCRAFKILMMQEPTLRLWEEGITIPAGTKSFSLPMVGIDWRTVVPTGNTGGYTVNNYIGQSIASEIVFNTTQTTPVTVAPFIRYSTYWIGVEDEVPIDILTYLGDPLKRSTALVQVPIAYATVDSFDLVRMTAHGERAQVYGTINIFGSADGGGLANLKIEVKKVWDKLRSQSVSSVGFMYMVLEAPTYARVRGYSGQVFACSIGFTTLIDLEASEALVDQSAPTRPTETAPIMFD